MGKGTRKVLALSVCLFALVAASIGFAGGKTETSTTASGQPPLLEYTVFTEALGDATLAPKDVVTPYVEKKFNIRVKEILEENTQTYQERMNQWIAAGNLPDVFLTSQVEFEATYNLGVYADVGKYVGAMKNLNKYFDQRYWPLFKNEGVLYQIPVVEVNLNDPKYASDPYNPGMGGFAIWVREDLLGKTGYKFTPLAQIEAATTAVGKKPTANDFRIDPAIKTPEDFAGFLRKVKALNITVGGRSMIPFSMKVTRQWHFGAMFDFGHWRIDEKGEVSGYLGNPEAKTYWKYLNTLYKEGLIDQDFLISMDDQVEERIITGRVGSSIILPGDKRDEEALLKVVPDGRIRYIPWPKSAANKGYYDAFKGGFRSVCINKDFKDIPRLVEYFDWFYSDEGLDICTWGPEEAGLWVMKDGKKVFKDAQVASDCLNGVTESRGYDYWGLYNWTADPSAWRSTAGKGVPGLSNYNPFSYQRSYPVSMSMLTVNRNLFAGGGMNFDGTCVYGDGTELTNAVSTWYWDLFQKQLTPKLVTAKTDAEFDAAWDEVYKEFLDKTQYVKAEAAVKAYFASLKK